MERYASNCTGFSLKTQWRNNWVRFTTDRSLPPNGTMKPRLVITSLLRSKERENESKSRKHCSTTYSAQHGNRMVCIVDQVVKTTRPEFVSNFQHVCSLRLAKSNWQCCTCFAYWTKPPEGDPLGRGVLKTVASYIARRHRMELNRIRTNPPRIPDDLYF